jgi:hypothetical protein
MGHGVSIPTHPSLKYQKKFLEVEKKCSNGYYRSDLLEYRSAVSSAIEAEALDFLEVLLVGGPARTIFPLHIAASSGILSHQHKLELTYDLTPKHCCITSAIN